MSTLSPNQLQFVQSASHNIRLLAPAGSGKTYSLLQRAHRLVELSGGTERVIILVFTRAARDELSARLEDDPQFEATQGNILVSTLNAWGDRRVKQSLSNARLVHGAYSERELVLNTLRAEWIRDEVMKKSFEGRRKLANASTALDAFNNLQDLGFHPSRTTTEEIQAHLTWLEEMQLTPMVVALERNLKNASILSKNAELSRFIRFWSKCVTALKLSGHYRLNDQKFLPWLDLEERLQGDQRPRGASRYHHIFVDEFQDIGALDANLIRCLREYHDATLTIAGDDDQAVYEWRAASVEFILRPEETFGIVFETIVLEENYRSPANIVENARRLIEHNERRVAKKTIAIRSNQASIRTLNDESATERTLSVFNYCTEVLAHNPAARIALLSRKRSHLLPLQILCAEKNFAFSAAEDLNVLLSDSFKALMNVISSRSILELPAATRRQIGPEYTAEAIVRRLINSTLRFPLNRSDCQRLRLYMRQAVNSETCQVLEHLALYVGPLGNAPNEHGETSARLAFIIGEFLRARSVTAALKVIGEHFEGMQADYVRSDDDVFHTDPPFEQLVDFSSRYGDDFQGFHDALSNASEAHRDALESGDAHTNIFLMTALRAKGREFDNVVLLECSADYWPHSLAKTAAQIEAERRLFYVAVTRVQHELAFSFNLADETQSPFLSEFFGGNDRIPQ